ncbi:hypothetical protein ACFY1L_43890 [Streptomyces sp. NPDC001663]|uniref:hypothetical protein n=1 Tax=Streptomyces sp. NPDC001663 TaxID=3364597 RepID=UPI00368D5831
MVVLPVEVTEPNPATPRNSGPSAFRRLLPAALALLLAAPVLAAAHQVRPAPYGDRLTVHARGEHGTATGLRTHRASVEAYDWSYAREGRRPLAVLPARGEAIALWDDGVVTDTDGVSVRWHRALPAAADWLPAQGGTGVLRPLGRGMLAVVTPPRITGYRIADGDLRWVLPAHQGCAFAPARAVRHAGVLLVAQPCRTGTWTAQLIAVDDRGRISPHHRPRRNEASGGRPEHANTEKVVAQPR